MTNRRGLPAAIQTILALFAAFVAFSLQEAIKPGKSWMGWVAFGVLCTLSARFLIGSAIHLTVEHSRGKSRPNQTGELLLDFSFLVGYGVLVARMALVGNREGMLPLAILLLFLALLWGRADQSIRSTANPTASDPDDWWGFWIALDWAHLFFLAAAYIGGCFNVGEPSLRWRSLLAFSTLILFIDCVLLVRVIRGIRTSANKATFMVVRGAFATIVLAAVVWGGLVVVGTIVGEGRLAAAEAYSRSAGVKLQFGLILIVAAALFGAAGAIATAAMDLGRFVIASNTPQLQSGLWVGLIAVVVGGALALRTELPALPSRTADVVFVTTRAAGRPMVSMFFMLAVGDKKGEGVDLTKMHKEYLVPVIDSLVACGTRNPAIPARVRVRGFSDSNEFRNAGDGQRRKNLANQRARNVWDLIGKHVTGRVAKSPETKGALEVELTEWKSVEQMERALDFRTDQLKSTGQGLDEGQLNRRVDVIVEDAGTCLDWRPPQG